MEPAKKAVAERLARSHYEIEPGIRQVFLYSNTPDREDDPDEPIKLLEVNENTLPAGVIPIHFRPHRASGITYPSEIVEIAPEEFDRIGSGLLLPEGWSAREPIERPVAASDTIA